MNRRGFLQALALGVPMMAVSQEIADLLTPERVIFLPPKSGWPTWETVMFKGLPLTRRAAETLVTLMERRINQAHNHWMEYFSADTCLYEPDTFVPLIGWAGDPAPKMPTVKALPSLEFQYIEKRGTLSIPTHASLPPIYPADTDARWGI